MSAERSSGEPSAIPEEPFIAEYELAAISNFESLLADSFGDEQAIVKLDDLDTIVSLLNRLRSTKKVDAAAEFLAGAARFGEIAKSLRTRSALSGGIPRSLSEEPTCPEDAA